VRALAVALLLCGCDPVWNLTAEVTSTDGAPLEGAAVVLTGCPEQNEHDLGIVAAMTDSAGEAFVGGLGCQYPETCAVTVAMPGFTTYQTTFVELCDGDVSDCHRSQTLGVVLEAIP
jgi:hypothetical protein